MEEKHFHGKIRATSYGFQLYVENHWENVHTMGVGRDSPLRGMDFLGNYYDFPETDSFTMADFIKNKKIDILKINGCIKYDQPCDDIEYDGNN